MGDRRGMIAEALRLLEEGGVAVRRTSRFIETDPVGGPPQGRYLNGVAEAWTALDPQAVLTLAKRIERRLGRRDTGRNGPRPIDIDILIYGDRRIRTPDLIVPHPRMRARSFVMGPLLEIAPCFASSEERP